MEMNGTVCTRAHLVFYMKGWTVLWLAFAAVVETGSGHVRVPEPFLDLGDVGLMRESVRCRRRPQRMHAQPVRFSIDSGLTPVFPDDVAIDGAGVQMLVQRTCAVVLHGPEEGTV